MHGYLLVKIEYNYEVILTLLLQSILWNPSAFSFTDFRCTHCRRFQPTDKMQPLPTEL